MGERGYLSTVTGRLAEVPCAQAGSTKRSR
jgi:hypothetical protein